jgi:sulfopyruvate decarboxylase subunit alpha
MTPAKALYDQLRGSGIDFFVSVPCRFLDDLIRLADDDPNAFHTPVTREEEGLGIMAGAALSGRRPAMIMQNTGLGNCVNAICSLVNYYEFSFVFVVSHRGSIGENIDAQRPMGEVTSQVFGDVDVDVFDLHRTDQLPAVGEAIPAAAAARRSIALLAPPPYWSQP